MRTITRKLAVAAAAELALIIAMTPAPAQQPSDFFKVADANADGRISRDELRSAMTNWLGGRESATADQLQAGLNAAFPESTFMAMISPPPSQTPKPEDVAKMMGALPSSAPAKPARPRKVLVLNKCAGFIHSSIPLAAKTIEQLGEKTGAWTTTVSYDAAVITAANLKHYDLVFLNNTTGQFLDDPDPAVTAARKKALLDFVRSGKGLAGIHAASDSYHRSTEGPAFGGMLTSGILGAADRNEDKSVDTQEMTALAGAWFEKADAAHAGAVSVQDFKAAFPRILFGMRGQRRSGPPAAQAGRPGPDPQIGTWPEFNKLIGGYFKYHWLDPQHIVYRIDDPDSPLTTMFRDGFEINDETYTFGMKSWSRDNLHVLTSIDYPKMSKEDKRKEDYPRPDHDYGLSWIRREGKGRVFYAAHGHSERVYAMRPMLEHLLAGIQYALGDLKADDTPGEARKVSGAAGR
jgi:type 1 glutamine amidotransferase